MKKTQRASADRVRRRTLNKKVGAVRILYLFFCDFTPRNRAGFIHLKIKFTKKALSEVAGRSAFVVFRFSRNCIPRCLWATFGDLLAVLALDGHSELSSSTTSAGIIILQKNNNKSITNSLRKQAGQPKFPSANTIRSIRANFVPPGRHHTLGLLSR